MEDQLREKVNSVIADLNDVLIERGTAIELAITALFAGEHLFLFGVPGTAKSLLVRELCKRIQDSTYFEYLLTKFTSPDEIFGSPDVQAIMQGKFRRVTKGSLVESNIAFLDEIFKANSSILNALLTALNERLYQERGDVKDLPLLSMFCASNELPEDESLKALYDRILIRYEVQGIQDDNNIDYLLNYSDREPFEYLTLDEIKLVQLQVEQIKLGKGAITGIKKIKFLLAKEGISISDRRLVKIVKILKAKAWIEGSNKVLTDHLDILVHCLWDEPKQRSTVKRVVYRVCNPLQIQAMKMEDQAKDVYDKKPKVENKTPDQIERLCEPLINQLHDISQLLKEKIERSNSSKKKIDKASESLVKINKWKRELSMITFQNSNYSDLR